MKKTIITICLCCFSFILVSFTPKPVYAEDNIGQIVLIGVLAAVGICAIIVPIGLIASDNEWKEMAQRKHKERESKYNARLNNWTTDAMLSELGNPSSVSQGDRILVYTYDYTQKKNVGETTYHEGNFFEEATSEYSGTEVREGEVYTFTFDKIQKVLKKWFYRRYSQSRPVDEDGNEFKGTGAQDNAVAVNEKAQPAGIGAKIKVVDGQFTMISLGKGGPAEQAGIKVGDKIISIDGESTEGMASDSVISRLRGEPGTKVKLSVKRDGEENVKREFMLTRAIIQNIKNWTAPAAAAVPASPLELKLKQAKDMKDKGVITDEEYKEMRKKILDAVK